jgi:hypothetical protein
MNLNGTVTTPNEESTYVQRTFLLSLDDVYKSHNQCYAEHTHQDYGYLDPCID